MEPQLITHLGPGVDDVLLLAASWEERCLGLVRKAEGYRATHVILTEYDGVSKRRQQHLVELHARLTEMGNVTVVPALHANPLANVRHTLGILAEMQSARPLKLSIDISTFTRKHLLQLLHGLDSLDFLRECRFFHTEAYDYDTRNDEPVSQGISDVRVIDTFAGRNAPSRDSLLIIFLGYEGRRALALWEHLEANITVAVVPEPPYKAEWQGRTQALNQYLLSCLPESRVLFCPSLDVDATEALLRSLASTPELSIDRYNYRLAPLGPKPQVIGLYRFFRRFQHQVTVVYADPIRYREEYPSFAPGRSWLVDQSSDWSRHS